MTDNKNKPQIRKAEDNAAAPRKTYMDIFKDFDPVNYKMQGTMNLQDLPEDLFGAHVLNTPAEIDKFTRLGFVSGDDFKSHLGETEEGLFTHKSTGEHIRIMYCSAEQRRIRHERDAAERLDQNKRIYANEINRERRKYNDPANGLPISVDREKSGIPIPGDYVDNQN